MIAIVTGWFLATLGLVLIVGGIWLAILGGTLAYVGLGAGWLISGVLLILRRRSALGVYALLLVLTLIWAWLEVGLDRWALLPRYALFGLVGLWLLAPWIYWPLRVAGSVPPDAGWRGARGALACAVVLTLVLGLVSLTHDPFDHPGALPTAAEPASAGSVSAPADDWTAYGGTLSGQHYSALKQVTPQNVRDLKVAWVYHTGESKTDPNEPEESTSEDTPLKIGDTLYVCSTHDNIIALDAGTGKQLWRYDPKVRVSHHNQHLTCRGLGYHSASVPPPAQAAVAAASSSAPPAASGRAATPAAASSVAAPALAANGACAQRLVLATIDARLIEVDAQTGKPCAGFGNAGQVDLMQGLGRVRQGDYMETSPPVVTSRLIIVGASINDNLSTVNPSGVIRAYDVDDGHLAWHWDAGKPDPTAPLKPGEDYTHNTPSAWPPLSADESLGMVYVPLGNASPDQLDLQRNAALENYGSAIVALSLADGHLVWSFQAVHRDHWDRDNPAQPTLIDLSVHGATVPALVQATKQGDVYVLDRRNGQPVLPVNEIPVATNGGAPGDRYSSVQPQSSFSFMPRPLTGADMWGATPFDQLWCRIRFKSARYDGPYTPLSTRPSIAYPGQLGVFDWGGVAVDPLRQALIATPVHMAYIFQLVPRPDPSANVVTKGQKEHFNENYGAPYAVVLKPFLSPIGVPCQQPPWGTLAGADLHDGRLAWMHRNGTTRKRMPGWLPIPFAMGVPGFGGPLITASGVVFYSGSIDQTFRAYDETTGRMLWQTRLPAGGQSTPMTYRVNGRQYVVVVAGGHGSAGTKLGDSIVAYSLPAQPAK